MTDEAEIAAQNLVRFQDEVTVLRMEQDRLRWLRSRPDCPEFMKPEIDERLRTVSAQLWAAEQSVAFLRERSDGHD